MQTEASDPADKSEDEAKSWVTQATKTFCKDKKGHPNASEEIPKNGEVGKMWGLVVTIDQMKSFAVEVEKNLKE